MKKYPASKLSLNRETILPLQSTELEDVHGGTVTPTIAISVRACVASARYCVQGAITVYKGTKWLRDHGPKPNGEPVSVGGNMCTA